MYSILYSIDFIHVLRRADALKLIQQSDLFLVRVSATVFGSQSNHSLNSQTKTYVKYEGSTQYGVTEVW